MNKILVAMAVMLVTATAFSFEAFNGTANLKQFNKIKCDGGLACSRSIDKLLISSAGGLQPQVAVTGNATITAAQCGSTFVSSATGVLTLPEASTVLGCRIRVVCGTVDDVDLNPADATDVIGITGSITGANTTTVLAPSAGDAIRCTDVGAGFTVEATGVNLWAVLGTTGIITDVN